MTRLAAALLIGLGSPAFAQLESLADDRSERGAEGFQMAPALQVETEMIEFGMMTNEHAPEAKVTFRNVGQGPLTISRVKGSCSCTVPNLTKLVYKPGESGELLVKFKPKKNQVGSVHQTVTIFSDDPDQPQFVVKVHADVTPRVGMLPPQVYFGQFDKGETRTIETKVMALETDFAVTDITATNDQWFDIEMGEPRHIKVHDWDATEIPLKVTIKANAPVGRIAETMTIRTTDVKDSLITASLSARIRGDLSAVPARLALGMLRPGQAYERDMRVISHSGKAFNIVGIEADHKFGEPVEVSFRPEHPEKKSAWIITVSGSIGEDARTPNRGDLVIRTDNPDQPEIIVTYYGTVRARG